MFPVGESVPLKLSVDCTDTSYQVTYSVGVLQLEIDEAAPGSLGRVEFHKDVNALQKLAIEDKESDRARLQTSFQNINVMDHRRLWKAFFDSLEKTNFFDKLFEQKVRGYASAIELFFSNVDWIDGDMLHPFLERTLNCLDDAMLDNASRASLLHALFVIAIYDKEPFIIERALKRCKDALSSWDPNPVIGERILKELADSRVFNACYQSNSLVFGQCLNQLSRWANEETKPLLKSIQIKFADQSENESSFLTATETVLKSVVKRSQ